MAARFSFPWLVSPRFDLAFFIGAGLPVLAIKLLDQAPTNVVNAVFLLGFVVMAGSHVGSTWSITHLNAELMQKHPFRYKWLALALLVGGGIWGTVSDIYFTVVVNLFVYWGMYHMAKQHYGFVMLYKAKGNNRDRIDYALDRYVLYATTLIPVLWVMGGRYEIFGQPLFHYAFPTWLLTTTQWVYGLALVVYVARQVLLLVQGQSLNVPKLLLMAVAILNWYVGFVLVQNPLLKYLTVNIFHSMQYDALVWFYNKNRWTGAPVSRGARFIAYLSQPHNAWKYILVAALYPVLAFTIEQTSLLLRLPIVFAAMESLPIYHYIVDGWIWKVRENRDLSVYLNLKPAPGGSPASSLSA